MIVSRKHKFIFVAIPKTGTHSVRQALRPALGPDDMEQVGLFVSKQFPIPELAKLQHGHVSLAQLRPHFAAEEFDQFLKFTFVRNPFDRFVSYCAFITRQSGQFARTPQEVMRFVVDNPPHHHVLFQPQHSFICDGDGRVLADQIGRVEQMQESFNMICARIGIAPASLEIVNRTSRGDYRDYFDAGLKGAVAKLYERDLDLFGYEF
jgi:hypothetical protein